MEWERERERERQNHDKKLCIKIMGDVVTWSFWFTAIFWLSLSHGDHYAEMIAEAAQNPGNRTLILNISELSVRAWNPWANHLCTCVLPSGSYSWEPAFSWPVFFGHCKSNTPPTTPQAIFTILVLHPILQWHPPVLLDSMSIHQSSPMVETCWTPGPQLSPRHEAAGRIAALVEVRFPSVAKAQATALRALGLQHLQRCATHGRQSQNRMDRTPRSPGNHEGSLLCHLRRHHHPSSSSLTPKSLQSLPYQSPSFK